MHEPEGYECPFCRIADGRLSQPIVYRNERVMTLVNIRWWENNPGGCLVVPIEHHENVYDLPVRLATPIQAAVREVALAMKSALGCDGISTRQHSEPAGSQDVWHYHVHVIPRFAGDNLHSSRYTTPDLAEVGRMSELLRAHLLTPDLNAMLHAKPSAAASVMTDEAGRILIVKPTYRTTWGLPGGGVDGTESPREGCAREIREELGLDLEPGALVAYEHRINDAGIDSHRFLFDGPTLTPQQIDAIVLPPDELSELRFVTLDEAIALLDPPLGRRLQVALEHRARGSAIYMENGVAIVDSSSPAIAPTQHR